MTEANKYYYLTAKERRFLSFPAKQLLNRGFLKGEVLDFGCGFGKDVELLRNRGVNIEGYDKHYFPKLPNKKFDTILCFYVLNVLLPEEQAEALIEVSRLLKPGGMAYFAVRRDVKREGYRIHKVHQLPTYQCNVKLPYESIFLNENCEIYQYSHYNQLGKRTKSNCPFCNLSQKVEMVAESATVYAIKDKYPVSPGHTLVIAKKHVANYFDLSFKDQSACWFMVDFVKKVLEQELHPDGFNVGLNIGQAAGQTVDHVHIHIIPRYEGDVKNPRGGVRHVIAGKGYY